MPVVDQQEEALRRIRKAKHDGLKILDLSSLGLKSLPPEIGRLTSLQMLELSLNSLTSLPAEIWRLTALIHLYAHKNQIVYVSPEIRKLENLRSLGLMKNELSSLPVAIGACKCLTSLGLSGNKLSSLPAEIGKLTQLRDLFLIDNELSSLPPELGNLKNLYNLYLRHNPLPDALIDLANKDAQAALAYIRDQGPEGGEPLYEAKLVLVGEGDVGKTCLLHALQGKPFTRQKTTKGMEVAREPLPLPHPETGPEIMLNAWDFGGQKEYQITHQFFFSPRSLYLVVWDPRSGHEKCDVDGWISRIRLRVGDDATILVVATHCRDGDPPPAVNIDKDRLREKYGETIAGFFEIDSYENKNTSVQRFGIDELREKIATLAAGLRGMGDPLPPSWIEAREKIVDLTKGRKKTPWISRGDFAEICRKPGLADDAINGLLILMHELGQIVYFGRRADDPASAVAIGDDEKRLGDVVVLMPEWLAKAVCFAIEDKATRNAAGVLRYDRLPMIWRDDRKKDEKYDPKLYPYFLALMEKYDICYRLEDGASSLVPQLIDLARPKDLDWYPESEPQKVSQLALSCELDEVPPGLVPLMIVRTHRFSKQDKHWELGAFLDYRSYGTAHMALVDRELMFTVRGEYPTHFMTLLTDSFEVLVDEVWPGLKARYRLSIPCPSRIDGALCPGRFELEALRAFFAEGDTTERCRRCKQKYEIARLLLGLSTPGIARDEPFARLEALIKETAAEGALVTKKEGRRTRHRIDTLESSSAQQFRQILASMHSETVTAPGMFTLLPEGGKWLKIQGKRRYCLTLWCEYPECPHPLCKIGSGGEGEYKFERSADWLIKLAPVITWTARVLKVALPIASGVIKAGLDEWDLKGLKPKLDLMEKCARALPGGELETLDGAEQPTGFSKRPAGAELREFHDLLQAEVKGRRWGGLRRLPTKTGDYLWLCPQHYAEFDPALLDLS